MLVGGIAAAGVLSLVVSNPSLEDYQAHAGDQLVRLGTKELCDEPTPANGAASLDTQLP